MMDGKNVGKNKPLNNSEKAKNDFLQALETQHTKEFAVINYDAVLGSIHKSNLHNIDPGKLLLEEFISFNDTGYCNTRLLNLGYLSPLFAYVPVASEYKTLHPEYTLTKFLPITFILRGAKILEDKFKDLNWNNYLNQFDNTCYHLSNQLSAKLGKSTKVTPAQVVLKNIAFKASDTTNVRLFIDDETFVSSIDENEEYVVFINCTYHFALDYLAEDNLKIQCTQNFKISDGLYGRFILNCRQQPSYKGPTSPCVFPTIFDKFLKTTILYECPATYLLLDTFVNNNQKNKKETQYQEKTKEIYHQLRLCYKNNKKFSQCVLPSDQFGGLGAAIAGVNSISPQFIASYRDVTAGDMNVKSRWIPIIPQLVEANRVINNQILDETKQDNDKEEDSGVTEYLNLLPLELRAVLNYSHGIFHANYFKNNNELEKEHQYEKDKILGLYSNSSANSSGLEIKNIRLKPINSVYIWDDAQLSPLENILFNFCGNIYLFKKFLVMNCLIFIANETNEWWKVQGYHTLPVPTDIKIAGSAIQLGTNYDCHSCDSVFYHDNKYCLCFLVVKVLAKLTDCLHLGANTLPLLKRLYDVYFDIKTMKPNHLIYNGQHTSYKNSMTVVVHELNSNLSYFGDARLKNEGNDKGFAVRGKLYDRKKNNESMQRLSMNNNDSNITSGLNINEQVSMDIENDTLLDSKPKTEEVNTNEFASTRKLSVIVEDVRRYLKENASIIDPAYQLEIKNPKNYLIHNYQKLWIDPGMTPKGFSYLSGCVILNTSELIKVALGKYNTKVENMQLEQKNYYRDSTNKSKYLKSKRGININDVINDDSVTSSPPCKKRKQSIKVSKFLESCLAATLYDDFPSQMKIKPEYYEIIEKINNDKPKGVNTLIQSYIHMISSSDKNLLWYTTNIIVKRLVTLIDDVNTALSRILCMSPNTLEDSWKNFVLSKNKISKDAYIVFDPWFGNSFHRRMTYLMLFGTIKHQADVKRKSVADNVEVQTTIMEKGCLMGIKIKKEMDLHHILIDDEMLTCKLTDQAKNEFKTPIDAFLPTRIKIKLNTHPFQNDNNKTSAFYWLGQRHAYDDVGTDEDDEEEEEEEEEGEEDFEDDNDIDVRFIPKSILRTDGSNTVKSPHELYTILKSEGCKLSKLASGTMAKTSSFKQVVNFLIEYITHRTEHSNLTNGYPCIIIRLFSLLAQVRTKFNNIYTSVFANLDLDNLLTLDHKKAVENCAPMTGKEILLLYLKRCTKEDFKAVLALYLIVLFAELYSPTFYIKTTFEQMDMDYMILNTIVAGCLHLFIGSDDCNKLIKKDNIKQQHLIPNVFWYPFMSNNQGVIKSILDVKNTYGYYAQFDCTWNSFIGQHSPDVFTSLKSNYMIRNSCLTTLQKIPQSYEQNDIMCLPLSKVKQSKIYNKSLCLEEIMNTMSFMDMVKFLFDKWSIYADEVMNLYCSNFNHELLPETKDDFLQHCFQIHGDISADEKLYFQQLLFEQRIFNSVVTQDNTNMKSNIYDVWSDDDDEEEEEEEEEEED
jgi:hypothetical protein